MGIVGIAEIRPNMVLGADLRSHKDRLLFRKGTRLTKKNLQIMKTWGIVEVDIEGISEKDLEENLLARKDPKLIRAVEHSCGSNGAAMQGNQALNPANRLHAPQRGHPEADQLCQWHRPGSQQRHESFGQAAENRQQRFLRISQ